MIEDEDYTNNNLYSSARLSYVGKNTYDCGDGEKSYKTKDSIIIIQNSIYLKLLKILLSV